MDDANWISDSSRSGDLSRPPWYEDNTKLDTKRAAISSATSLNFYECLRKKIQKGLYPEVSIHTCRPAGTLLRPDNLEEPELVEVKLGVGTSRIKFEFLIVAVTLPAQEYTRGVAAQVYSFVCSWVNNSKDFFKKLGIEPNYDRNCQIDVRNCKAIHECFYKVAVDVRLRESLSADMDRVAQELKKARMAQERARQDGTVTLGESQGLDLSKSIEGIIRKNLVSKFADLNVFEISFGESITRSLNTINLTVDCIPKNSRAVLFRGNFFLWWAGEELELVKTTQKVVEMLEGVMSGREVRYDQMNGRIDSIPGIVGAKFERPRPIIPDFSKKSTWYKEDLREYDSYYSGQEFDSYISGQFGEEESEPKEVEPAVKVEMGPSVTVPPPTAPLQEIIGVQATAAGPTLVGGDIIATPDKELDRLLSSVSTDDTLTYRKAAEIEALQAKIDKLEREMIRRKEAQAQEIALQAAQAKIDEEIKKGLGAWRRYEVGVDKSSLRGETIMMPLFPPAFDISTKPEKPEEKTKPNFGELGARLLDLD